MKHVPARTDGAGIYLAAAKGPKALHEVSYNSEAKLLVIACNLTAQSNVSVCLACP